MNKRIVALAALVGATVSALAVVPQLASAKVPPALAQAPSSMSGGQTVDINSASKGELTTLAGIGQDRSDAIIRNRPFRSKDELVNRHIVPAGVYGQIHNQIAIRQ